MLASLASVRAPLSFCDQDRPVRIYSFTMEEGHTKLSLSFSNDHCNELVCNFKDFMLGAGFLESSVIEAMEGVIEEYESLHPRKDNAEPSPID